MTMRSILVVGWLAALSCAPITSLGADKAAQEAPSRRMTLDRIYSLPWIIGTAPGNPVFSPDSRRLAFLWNDEGTNFRDVWVVDVSGGAPRRVTAMPRPSAPADPGTDIHKLEQVERAETDSGVDEVAWAADGRHLLFTVHGALYRVLPGKSPEPLTEAGSAVSDLAVSQRGNVLAWRADRELKAMQLRPGKHNVRVLHVPEQARASVESFTWSADGSRIAFIESDSTDVPRRGIPDYLGEETRLVEIERAFPGEPSESRRVGVVEVNGAAVRWIDLAGDPRDLIFDVRWSPDGRHLLVDTSDLYIKHRRLLVVDVDSGRARTLVEESDPHNVTAEWWADWAPDGASIFFTSDRGEDYRVYRQSLDAEDAVPVTSGKGAVFEASISAGAEALFVVDNAGNAESRRVSRVSLDGGQQRLVTPEPGAHHPVVSPDGRFLADLYSNDVTPPDLYLRSTRADGSKTRRVTHSPLPEFDAYRWIAPKYVTFATVEDGTRLHARLTLPPDFDPSRKYPAILGSVYSNSVHNEWGGRIYHPTWGLDQFLAQQGFVIMNVDISGSSGYGKTFRQRIGEDYGGVDVDDLYSATRYLVDQGYVDADRIGIWGSSYGGLLTTMSMFRYPDVYKAGVAGAPATSLFHALTGEMRTMMAPQGHEAQYRKSSAFLRSGDLEGHLMIIHGMRDPIVLFKDSVTLVQRLILQGKDVDFVVLPNAPHGWDTRGLAQTRFAFRKLYEHFKRYLGNPEPASQATEARTVPR